VGQFQANAVQFCDNVSSAMYTAYPWKDTITTTVTAPGLTPLLNGVQDYSAYAPNISRLFNVAIWNTTQVPPIVQDLNVVDQLAVDLIQRSYTAIRAVALQQGVGLIRLEGAVNVPTGMLLELRYDYQINPTKIVTLSQDCWFDDKYAHVAQEGLLYWGYKLSDDPRAGAAVVDAASGRFTYSGQLAVFHAMLQTMQAAEDLGSSELLFPSQPMGQGRDDNALNIFGV
jgi:hypothetical protein